MQQIQGSLQWYTRRDSVIRGPFTAENITQYLLLGRIRLDDELSRDRLHWSSASRFGEFLPPELANLTSWEDYQQLVVARMQADERKSDRRCGNCSNWLKWKKERREKTDRRKGENNLLTSQYLFSDVVSHATGRMQASSVRAVLLSLLLVVLIIAYLLPLQG